MSFGEFDNEANLLAYRQWSERLKELVLNAAKEFPERLARAGEARELGVHDPLSTLPEALFEGLDTTRDDPESAVRGLYAFQRAAGEVILEMLRVHWQQTGSSLTP